MEIDTSALTAQAQAEVDDASCDHNYVQGKGLTRMPDRGGFGVTGDLTEKKIAMLVRMVVQHARIYRANSGIGRPIVGIFQTRDGLDAHWQACKSPADLFDISRAVRSPKADA